MGTIKSMFSSNTVRGVAGLAAIWWLEKQGILPPGTLTTAAGTSGLFPEGGLAAIAQLAAAVSGVVAVFGLRNVALKAASSIGSSVAPK